MTNRFRDPVGYSKFRTQPLLAEGLLAVARSGGELEEKAAAALFRLADTAGAYADKAAAYAGERAGAADAVAGGPAGEADYPIGGATSVRGANFSAEVRDAIHSASVKYGIDEDYLLRSAQIESGGNPKAFNKGSKAAGLFQFIPGTAKQYGLTDPFDTYASADAAARLARDNKNHLRRVLGREPTRGELYLAHQQGAGGAEKLLTDPKQLASAAVGARAVASNGGSPGMQAGEFAALWTRKFDGGYAMPDHPDQLAGGAGAIKLTGGKWRPRGDNTIFGRAYDEAGTRAYLQQVDTEMRSITGQIYDAYKDDPAAMKKALASAKKLMLDPVEGHVFAEIAPDFSIGFDRMAESYLSQGRDNYRAKIERQDKADFITSTTSLESDIASRVERLDPKNPNTADAIASAQAALDDHYDSAVQRGILEPDEAARAKVERRRGTALAFYKKQADGLDADGVAKMRKDMAADYVDGGIDGLDGDGWQTLSTGLERLEADKRLKSRQATEDYQARGDAQAARVAAGFDPDPAALGRLVLDTGSSAEGKAAMVETYAKISAASAINDLSLQQGRDYVAGLRKQYGDAPSAAQLRTLAFAEDTLAKKRVALATDPVSYAEARGVVPATPSLVEAQSGDDVVTIMASRTRNAQDAAERYGIAPRYLKDGEAKAVAAAVRANPAQGAVLAAGIVGGAGDRAPEVLAEFGQDAPMISEAGAILAFGGSPRAAEDVILGYGRGADGKVQKGLKPEAAAASYQDVAGDALALAAKDNDRIGRAAASIARHRISVEGVEPDSDEADAIYRQAVQEAAGATFDRGVQFGGFADVGGPVLVPPTMRADSFGEVLASITDADLATLAVKPKAGVGYYAAGRGGGGRVAKGLAATLQGARPVIVKGGYAFAYGDPASDDPQFVQDEKGGVFVLDLGALAPKLAARIPEAFR